LGHILVNRSAAALQPGSARVRAVVDPRRCAHVVSAPSTRQDDVARDFLLWFAPFQFASGKVPCCATARGADPVPENDSDGEFAFAAADLWRYTRDEAPRARCGRMCDARRAHGRAAASERTPANRAPSARLLRPDAALDQPRGLLRQAGVLVLGRLLGRDRLPQRVELRQAWASRTTRRASPRSATNSSPTCSRRSPPARAARLDVLPGAADRGDVDPTSSTIALSPGGLLGTLPDALVRNTFERYWRDFSERGSAATPWDAYTPYEWRNVGSLVRLGERERALQAMAFFYAPSPAGGWNQWAEVVLRDAREPRFLGDMPHGWVASDQIRSVLDLFAYEARGRAVAGARRRNPIAWFDGPGPDGAGTAHAVRPPAAGAAERSRERAHGRRDRRPGPCARSRRAESSCAGRGPSRRGCRSTASQAAVPPIRSDCRRHPRTSASSSRNEVRVPSRRGHEGSGCAPSSAAFAPRRAGGELGLISQTGIDDR
jgi:hypothetical protein